MELMSGNVADPSTVNKPALKAAIDTFKHEIGEFLSNEDAEDKELFAVEKGKHASCISVFTTRGQGDVATFKQAHHVASGRHKACRKSERSWYDFKAKMKLCLDETNHLHHVPDQCDTDEGMCTLKEQARSDAVSYSNLLTPGESTLDCDSEQQAKEERFCEYKVAKEGACAGLKGCINLVDLAEFGLNMQDRASGRRKLWQEVLLLECHVDNLNVADYTNATTTDDCTAEAVDNLYVLDTSVPEAPTCQEAVQTFPNDATCADWKEQEYNWESHTYIVPSKCRHTCTVFTPTEIPEGCKDYADSSAECDFYRHHQDACGHYDTDSFEAKTHCCACGGGELGLQPTGNERVYVPDHAKNMDTVDCSYAPACVKDEWIWENGHYYAYADPVNKGSGCGVNGSEPGRVWAKIKFKKPFFMTALGLTRMHYWWDGRAKEITVTYSDSTTLVIDWPLEADSQKDLTIDPPKLTDSLEVRTTACWPNKEPHLWDNGRKDEGYGWTLKVKGKEAVKPES